MNLDKAIQRIVELSAEAHIKRREAADDSAAFHSLTGAIVAYGKALELLTTLQQREELYAIIGVLELSESASKLVN